ncbi:MAG: Oxygen regulatory protein NreC [Anaerolineae bacterium]|nr:Oxygen regulatory protein NreC [Anaerolineae bacterium]
MTKPIRIFLTDDHAVLRAGLKALLNAEPDMQVVGEGGGEDDCLSPILALQPDVVLLDINMPCCNGLDLLAALRRELPQSRVLVLTMHDDSVYLRQVLATGGAGYVLKEAADTELLTAIRTVYNGGVFLHPEHAKILLEDSLKQLPQPAADDDPFTRLSDREVEVLRLIALGHSNKEIAEMLYLSVKTVETYKARVMEKLALKSRAALVRFALHHRLLDQGKS